MTELFKITWPMQLPVGSENMYYRTEYACPIWENGKVQYISIHKNQNISLESYFNVFSYSKYLKYTNVNQVNIELELEGDFQIFVCAQRQNGMSVIGNDSIRYEKRTIWKFSRDFSIEDSTVTGYYYIRLLCLKDKSKIYGGRYTTDCIPSNPVHIVMNICTFKRDKYVCHNVKSIVDSLVKSDKSSVKNDIDIYVIDNGQTLKGKIDENSVVHLFENKNFGGSGGFTRGMMEAYYRRDKITHVLMSDDDTIIDPHVLEKTINLLKFIRPEYKMAHIAGGMLHLDQPCFQEEAGCNWESYVKSQKKLTLLDAPNLLFNDVDDYPMYGAWWYLCMPIEVLNEYNFPLPLFIKCDDVEFGLRNIDETIVMNGIAVWHEAFDKKYSQHLEYYIKRNDLLINSLYEEKTGIKVTPQMVLNRYFKYVMNQLLRQRYNVANMMMDGMEDYLKGVDYFISQKEDEVLKKLLCQNEKLKTKKELEQEGYIVSIQKYKQSKENETFEKANKWFRKSFPALLIPTCFYNKNLVTVDYLTCHPRQFKKNKYVLQWNNYEKKGYVTTVSKRKFWKGFWRFWIIYTKYLFNLYHVKKSYKKRIGEICTLDYWERHLELK